MLADISVPVLLAHALAARQDLPIPEWLFAWAASIVLIVSFFALAVGWREPRFERDDWRPFGQRLSRAALHPVTVASLRRARRLPARRGGLRGPRGTEAPDRNFALTFVFVTAWLGFPLLSVLLGDVFRAFNPWRAIGAGRAGRPSAAGRAGPAARSPTPSGWAAGRRRSR